MKVVPDNEETSAVQENDEEKQIVKKGSRFESTSGSLSASFNRHVSFQKLVRLFLNCLYSYDSEEAPFESKESNGSNTIADKVNQFKEERERMKKALYIAVVNFGLRTMGLALLNLVLAYVISAVGAEYLSDIGLAMWKALGDGLLIISLLMLTTCPYELLSMDHVFDRNPLVRYTLIVMFSLLGFIVMTMPPYVGALIYLGVLRMAVPDFFYWLPPAVGEFFDRFYFGAKSKYTTSFSITLLIWLFALFTVFTYAAIDPNSAEKTIIVANPLLVTDKSLVYLFLARSIIVGLGVIIATYEFLEMTTYMHVWRQEWRAKHNQHLDNKYVETRVVGEKSSTAALYKTLYSFFIIYGGNPIIHAIGCIIIGYGDPIEHILTIVDVVLIVLPVIILLAMGRQYWYKILSKYFERSQKVKDGAFIASLLDQYELQVGEPYSIIRQHEDATFLKSDKKRYWIEGVVDYVEVQSIEDGGATILTIRHEAETHIKGNKFRSAYGAVKATNMMNTNMMNKKRTSASASATIKDPTQTQLDGCKEHDEMGVLSIIGNIGKSFIGDHNAPKSSKTTQVVLNQSWGSPSEFIEHAERELRCIDWDVLEKNMAWLLGSSVREVDPNAPKIDAYTLSRPVPKGQKIDFFISHSWHDAAAPKVRELKKFAENFKAENGRGPTFWFDKVCISQSNIGLGLKLLPINLMSSDGLLVLCGETYARRLWCVWELFTVFTFSDLAATLETISLVPLAVNVPPENSTDVGDGTDVVDDVVVTLEDMCKFDVVNAKCFDPNEERKLLTVIDEVGRDKFHSSIRQLSRCCLDRYNADVEMAKGASSPGGIAKSTFSRHSSERR